MPAPLSVDPASLLAAAEVIGDESRCLLAEFASGEKTVGQAMAGWVGVSRAALNTAAGHWTAVAADLAGRVGRLDTALSTAGTTFAEMDRRHAAALRGHRGPS